MIDRVGLPGAPAPADISFERLLHAITPAAFFGQYWGRKPVLIRRGNPDFYRRVFSIDDIDAFIYAARPRPGEFRISRAGEGVDLEQKDLRNLDRSPPITDIYKQFVAGNTLVLHGVDMRWKPLAVVTRMLEFACACHVTANAYLTPAGEQGYPTHYDTHDFFIFQMDGSKEWYIESPDPAHRHPIRDLSRVARRESSETDGAPEKSNVTIGPGDLMYIPRGWVHHARASGEASLHMTVGVHGATWMQLAEAGIRRLGHEDHRLRANIPITPMPDGGARHDMEDGAAMLQDAFARIAPRDAFQELQSSYIGGEDPLPDGHFRALALAHTIGAQSSVTRRAGVSGAARLLDGDAVLLFLDKRFIRDADCLPAFSYMLAHAAFTPRDLPGLADEAIATELVKELVRLGFLTLAEPQSNPQPDASTDETTPTEKQDHGHH